MAFNDSSKLRYPSDVTDEEWAHISPLIPLAKHGGRKRSVDVREVVNGLMYILSTGCQWPAVPKDPPPRSTLFEYFDLWDCDGMGREASPTAGVIDSQSVKGAEKESLHRSAGLRRGQENQVWPMPNGWQGQEAPHPCR